MRKGRKFIYSHLTTESSLNSCYSHNNAENTSHYQELDLTHAILIGTTAALILLHGGVDTLPSSQLLVARESSFIIYCTSNHDGTGDCSRADTSEGIECELVPGSVINCTRNDGMPVQCVMVSSVLNAQAYFSCAPRRNAGVSGKRINLDRFDQPTTPSLPPTITPELPDPLTPLIDLFN